MTDFDDTLAHRPDPWSQCIIEVLDVYRPRHDVSLESLRPHLRAGFPWHHPEQSHPFNEPER